MCLVNIYPTEGTLAALMFPSSYYRYDQLTFFAPVAIKLRGSFESIWMPFDRWTWILMALSVLTTSFIETLLIRIEVGHLR